MIYRFIWSKLPGIFALKAFTASLVGIGIVALLFLVVFPWVDISFFAPPTVEG